MTITENWRSSRMLRNQLHKRFNRPKTVLKQDYVQKCSLLRNNRVSIISYSTTIHDSNTTSSHILQKKTFYVKLDYLLNKQSKNQSNLLMHAFISGNVFN